MNQENLPPTQQDGALPHYAVPTRFIRIGGLKTGVPEKEKRKGQAWPESSPDLSVLRFFLCRRFKSKIYAIQSENLQRLRNRIINECQQIVPGILSNVGDHF